MKADMQITGLDELRRRIAGGAAAVDREMRVALRESAEIVRDEARQRAPGQILRPSIQYRALTDGLTVIVGSVAKTALSIEQGRPVGSNPPVKLIVGWLHRKGLTGAVSLKTRKPIKSRGAAAAAEREQAYKLIAAIRRRGTKAQPFLMPAVPASEARVQDRIRNGMKRVLSGLAGSS